MFPWRDTPLPSLSEVRGIPRSQSFAEGAKLSLPIPPPLKGAPASPPSSIWLHRSLRCLLCYVDVLCWNMNVFFIVLWKGEFTSRAHSTMMLTSLSIEVYLLFFNKVIVVYLPPLFILSWNVTLFPSKWDLDPFLSLLFHNKVYNILQKYNFLLFWTYPLFPVTIFTFSFWWFSILLVYVL